MLEPSPHRVDRGRAFRKLLLLFVALVLLGVAAGGFVLYGTGASGASVPVRVEVPEGSSAGDVADLLETRDVIRSGAMFRILARIRGIGSFLQAGAYDMRTNMRVSEALDVLAEGPIVEDRNRVTIPEGFRLEQIAERVAEETSIDEGGFLEAATSGRHALPPFLPKRIDTVEGFLFPKTYEFPTDADANDVISTLLAQFEREVGDLEWRRARDLGISRFETVIIASLIEREARVAEDRAKISAVIHNRLELGMPLQIDATVQYALPEHKSRLTYEDYEYDSPYNTYLYAGLPPGPIASPGLDSLAAALAPEDVDYLYYLVIDCDGRHGFTSDYDEFLAMKANAPTCD